MYETKEILKDQFKKLPKDIQDAILAVDLRSKMQFITKKNNLHIDQAEALENEAVFVLLGLEHPNNLIANIAKHAEVSEEKAEAIAEDLNREIFLKVRESLKKIFEERKEEGSSLLGGSLLEKKDGEKRGSLLAGSLLGKTGEEELNREDILREIEDKEHHNLPSTNKTELHLEIPFPSEIVEKSTNFHLEAKLPSEIAPSGQIVFQNQKPANEIKREKPAEINPVRNFSVFEPKYKASEAINHSVAQQNIISNGINVESEQIPKKPFEFKDETLRTMPKDIIKAKMGGTVSVPKETVEIGDSKLPPKATQPNTGSKIDPYRESVG